MLMRVLPAASLVLLGSVAVGGARDAGARGPTARSFAFSTDRTRHAIDTIAESPVSLTASDGTGLELTSLDVQGLVEGPLAFTEMRMTFRNPEDRVREGHFRVTLPAGASVSRFAMMIDGRFQEG